MTSSSKEYYGINREGNAYSRNMLLSCRGQGDTITKRRNHRLLGRNQRLIERSEDMTEIEARSMDPKDQ